MARFPIRRKIFLALLGSIMILTLSGISISFLWGYSNLRNMLEADRSAIASSSALLIAKVIDERIDFLDTLLDNPIFVEELAAANHSHSELSKEELDKYFIEMDKMWVKAGPADSLVLDRLNTPAGHEMRRIINRLPNLLIGEMFITDKFGALVGASSTTSDYYQADENWWQRAYDSGKGAFFIGDIGFDESSGITAVAIAMPINDSQGKVSGIVKIVIDLKSFWEYIRVFSETKNIPIAVIDGFGNVVYDPEHKALVKEYMDKEMFEDLSGGRRSSFITRLKNDPENVHFLSFAVIPSKFMEANNIIWWMVLDSHVEGLFAPLQAYIRRGVLLLVILILASFIFSYSISGILTDPIMKLRSSIDRISIGDSEKLELPVEVKSGDEIEDFAVSFKNMLDNLNSTMVSRDTLLREVEERINTQSKLVETQDDLSKKAKALDGALQDSVESRHILMSMLEDNNSIRQELEDRVRELKSTRDMLIYSEKMASLGRLIAEIAHEVNNPLMIISGNAQLSIMDGVTKEEIAQNMKNIVAGCSTASGIIQRLLRFSKPGLSQTKEADINILLNRTIAIIEHQYALINIKIVKKLEVGIPLVRIDEQQIEEVFMNLFINARDAMPSGGGIEVVTSRGDDSLKIEVRDTGAGIADEVAAKIFEPFYTTKKGGSGLGLPISYSIVKAHKGDISFTSAVGMGTTFTIIFPLK